jgi:hypothetical protein
VLAFVELPPVLFPVVDSFELFSLVLSELPPVFELEILSAVEVKEPPVAEAITEAIVWANDEIETTFVTILTVFDTTAVLTVFTIVVVTDWQGEFEFC